MNRKLNEAQLEILSLFSENMEPSSLERLKENLMEFRAKELSDMLDQYLGKEELTPEDLLKEHLRTPYKSNDEDESSH